MPSVSLQHWQTDRIRRLIEMETHCAASAALAPANALLAEESLRGYVMLLSGHFQGFCRDLYTECVQVFASQMPASLQASIQAQFSTSLKINSNNPTVDTLRKDFERFAITLDFAADPSNGLRVTHLGQLNRWRNAVAHRTTGAPAGVPVLALTSVQAWRVSCEGLAAWLDGVMYNELRRLLGAAPW